MRKYWVISPNVHNNNTEGGWKKRISLEKIIAVGRQADDKGGGIQFKEHISVGDIVIVAQGANWQKEVLLAGVVSSEAHNENINGQFYQYRKLGLTIDNQELQNLGVNFTKKMHIEQLDEYQLYIN